jgi:uncharacterized protein YjhX (UPF0386 family)
MTTFSKQAQDALEVLKAGGEILSFHRKNSRLTHLYSPHGVKVKGFTTAAFWELKSAGVLKELDGGFYQIAN